MKIGDKVIVKKIESGDIWGSKPSKAFTEALAKNPNAIFTVVGDGLK